MTLCRMDALALGGRVAIAWSPAVSASIEESPGCCDATLRCDVHSCVNVRSCTAGQDAALVDACFAVLLALVLVSPNARWVVALCRRPLVYTGQIAYGLYLL